MSCAYLIAANVCSNLGSSIQATATPVVLRTLLNHYYLFMKSFPMKIPLVFKRPAAASANVRKRPAHFDATLPKCGVRRCPRSAMSRRAKYCRECFLSNASRSGLKSGGGVLGNAGGHGQKGNAGYANGR